MPKFRSCGSAKRLLILGLALYALDVSAQPPRLPSVDHNSLRLFLETYLNGVSTGQILEYRQTPDCLYVRPEELAAIGVELAATSTSELCLERYPQLSYSIVPQEQVIKLNLSAGQLRRQYIRVQQSASARHPPQAGAGAVLNLDLYADWLDQDGAESIRQAQSGFFDLRVFSGPTSFSQTVSGRSEAEPGLIRLETMIHWSDPDTLTSLRLGDTISGGLAWSRPVRFNGVQLQRNFSLQPNYLRYPGLALSGTTAVPSSVEVFVNNVRRFSTEVDSGPFVIADLPMITGQGEVRMQVRDILGRETTTLVPFYSAPSLLRPGLLDYSLDLGFLRRDFGRESDLYDMNVAGAASARLGLHRLLTIEGRVEAREQLSNAGLGAALGMGRWGVLSLFAAASQYTQERGSRLGVAYQFNRPGFAVYAAHRQTRDAFADLAAMVGSPPARRFSQLSLSFSRPHWGALGLGFVALDDPNGVDRVSGAAQTCFELAGCTSVEQGASRVASVSYSRQMAPRISLFATVFRSFSDDGSSGGSLSLNISLGSRMHSSAGYQVSNSRISASATATRSMPLSGTGPGWRVRVNDGARSAREADLGYRSRVGTIEAGIDHHDAWQRSSLRLSTAAVLMGGEAYLSNTIHDGFAIADVGLPGVRLRHANREVGVSGRSGRLLIPRLTSYYDNKLSIDPNSLPPGYEVAMSERPAVPYAKAGVMVDFEVRKPAAAAVHLRQADGQDVPVGAVVQLDHDGSRYVVGYDGQTYLRGLRAMNQVTVRWSQGECRARFAYQAEATLTRIGPVACQ